MAHIYTNSKEFWSCQLNGKDRPTVFATQKAAEEARISRLDYIAEEFQRYSLTGESDLKMITTYQPGGKNTLRAVTLPQESNYPDIVRHHPPRTVLAEDWDTDCQIDWVATSAPCSPPRTTTEEMALRRANEGLMAENKRLRKLNAELKQQLQAKV